MTSDLHQHSTDTAPMRASGLIVPTETDKLYVLHVHDARGNCISVNLRGPHTRASLLAIHDAVAKLLDHDLADRVETVRAGYAARLTHGVIAATKDSGEGK